MQKIKNLLTPKMESVLVGKILNRVVYGKDKNGDIIIFLESEDRNVITIETKSPKVVTRLFTEQFRKYFNMN